MVKDSWQAGDRYEGFMGRWSRLAAGGFLEWLEAPSGLRWLDVGCGSGALSDTVIGRNDPSEVIAIDQSEGFVAAAQQRLGARAQCRVGSAMSLPLDDAAVDVSVSGLVLNFLPDPGKALDEMRRVTVRGGTVAVYVWDYAGEMEFLRYFWDAVVRLDPGASALHESNRFPDANADALRSVFEALGFADVETAAVDITTTFIDFSDYWDPFLGGRVRGRAMSRIWVPKIATDLNVRCGKRCRPARMVRSI